MSKYKPSKSKRSAVDSAVGCCIESLEARRLLTTWNWNALAIHQNQAVADFPSITGAGEAVVVVDTGADPNHPSLANQNIIWQDFYAGTSSPVDNDGHGTGMSGLIVGSGFIAPSDGSYGQGIAPGAQLIVLRIANNDDADPWGTQAARVSEAMNWVINHKSQYNIVAVNMSIGSDQGFTDTALTGDQNLAIDQQLQGQFATLASMGVFLGASSGNDGTTMPNTVEYPAADPNVYSVGSVNRVGVVSSFTSGGTLNDLLAPGEGIITPYYFPSDPSTFYTDNGTGTSFASPQVVGAAVLIKQIDPSFTPAQIAQIIEDSGTEVTDAATNNIFPLLNLDAALKLATSLASNSGGLNNHTAVTAAPMTFVNNTASRSGLPSTAFTQDFYSITLPVASSVNFQVAATGGAAPTSQLLDVNGTVLANVDGGATITLEPGTYYLLCTGGSTDLNGSYSISLQRTQSTVNNHTAVTAVSISLASGQGSATGAVLLGNLPDYYTFTIGTTKNVTALVNFSAGESATRTLLTAAGATVANIPSGGTTQHLAAGTYYVLVTSPTTQPNAYGVSFSDSPATTIPTVPGANASNAKIAYDPYGRLDMAYYDSVNHVLDFDMRNANGTWNTVTTIDSSPQAGTELSIAIDPYGNPGIAYYDAGTGHLKYAHFNGSAWTVTTVDATGVTGWYPSLVYTNAAAPYIAYFMASNLDLRVASLTGSKWSITTVDSKGNVGFVPSIAYDKATGVIGVAYQDLTHSWYKYASGTGRGWKITVVDTTTHAAGGSLSLAFDPSHLPEMTYNDAYTLNLKYARAASNGVWSVQSVNGNAHGMAANLTFDNTGAADIVYYNFFGGDIEHANRDGGLWSNTSITAGGSMLDESISTHGVRTLSWIAGGGVQLLDL